MAAELDANRGAAVPFVFGALAIVLGLATVAAARLASRGEASWVLPAVPALPAAAFAALALVAGSRVRRRRALAARQSIHPEQPWLWSDAWRDGRFEPATGGVTVLLVFVGLCAAAVAAGWLSHLQGGWTAAGLVTTILFTAIGLLLAGVAMHSALQSRKYPGAVFQMETVPGVLGGPLAGWVQLPQQVPAGVEVRVSVFCDRSVWTAGRSGERRRGNVREYEDQATLSLDESRRLPVRFTIPFDLPPSDLPDGGVGHPAQWHVSVSAEVPGVDFHVLFYNVPVFATRASDASIRRAAETVSGRAARPSDAKSVLVEAGPDRTVFALAPVKGTRAAPVVFALLPALTWLVSSAAGAEPAFGLRAAAIAAAAGAALLALVWVLGAASPTAIEIDADAVRVAHGAWPLRWTRTIPVADVAEITFQADSESQVLRAVTTQGRRSWLAIDLSGVEEAKWLAAEVSRALARYRPHGAPVPAHRQGTA